MQAADLSRKSLRDHRKQPKTEARQLRHDWNETVLLEKCTSQKISHSTSHKVLASIGNVLD